MKMSRGCQFEELKSGQEINTEWGIFTVDQGISIGRCCEVYEATDRKNGNQVALKVFRRHQVYQGALQRELVFLQILTQPQAPIVHHYGALQWQDRDILVQELLSGTARDIVLSHEGRTISPWLIVTLASNLIRGLDHLHKFGVVHADLKPPNILWCADSGAFKIIDFGVSYSTSEVIAHAIQSKGYQAPETIKWNRSCKSDDSLDESTERPERPGPPSDVWSAGCIMAEFFTAKKLFSEYNGENPHLVIAETLSTVATSYRKEFLQSAIKFISRCMNVLAHERPTASCLLEDPWLQQYHRPSLHDLLLLPTSVIRMMHVIEQHQVNDHREFKEIGEDLLDACQQYGSVESHLLDPSLRHFYVQFKVAIDAETTMQRLNRRTFNNRILVITFFPRNLWDKKELF